MRRVTFALSLASLLLLLEVPAVLAAGGGNPPPFIPVIVNPAIQAIILVDTHVPGSTPTAGKASIFLRNGTITTQAIFDVVPSAASVWASGCNPSLTGARFLWAPPTDESTLFGWVPPFVLDSIFLPFGILPSSVGGPVPVITQISNGGGNGECVQSPAGSGTSGWLLMNATIQFLIPAK
jgi:hypothetical protein